MAYSSCRVNKGLNFFEKLMRAGFQYFSNKLKRYSIKIDSDYSSDSCSGKRSVRGENVIIALLQNLAI